MNAGNVTTASVNHHMAVMVSDNGMSATVAASASENLPADSASENLPEASVNLMAAVATNQGSVVAAAASAETMNDSTASTVTERSVLGVS
jgi:hypothetical protein